jgi:hypothetical protein
MAKNVARQVTLIVLITHEGFVEREPDYYIWSKQMQRQKRAQVCCLRCCVVSASLRQLLKKIKWIDKKR